MIRAQIRSLYSLQVENLDSFAPEDPENFCVPVRVLVGPKGQPGEESYDIQVCSPKWLDSVCKREFFVVGRHYLVVSEYDFLRIRSVITRLVERVAGDSWDEVAEKLARIGYWEFEDYHEGRVARIPREI